MQSSKNFFELVESFRKNIDWLNEIMIGGDHDSIVIDGVSKPSIDKRFADRFGALQAMVNGRVAYYTKAALLASGAPPADKPLAEVWKDPVRENNGLYGWSGAGWEKSPYDSTAEFVSMVSDVRKDFGEANTSHDRAGLSAGLPPLVTDNGNEYAGGISDGLGRLIMAFGINGAINIFTTLAVGFASFKTQHDRAGFATDDGDISMGVRRGGTPFLGSVEHDISPDAAYAICDEAGRVAFMIHSDGTIETVGQQTGDDGGEFAWSIQDKKGRVALMVKNDGTVDFIPSPSLVEKLSPSTLPPFKPLLTERVHLLMHGQSLSVGLGSKPSISEPTQSGALMPNVGTYDGELKINNEGLFEGLKQGPPASHSFIPMQTVGNETRGNEVPIAGACEQLQKMLNDDVGFGVHSVIGSNCGHGGYRIDQLDREGNGGGATPNYLLGVEQSKQYREISSASGQHCLTQAMLWMQGETDISQGTTAAEYKRRLSNLITDFSNDIKQGYQPMLLTYQVGSHTKRHPSPLPDIPVAQWELSNEHPYVALACPTYVFPYSPDGVHLPAHSSRWVGCYFGKVMYRILKGEDWKPLQPESVNRQGKVVWLQMHVPNPPLVIDTQRVTDPGHYGFEVWAGGTKQIIDSVSLVGSEQIKIVLKTAPSVPVEVRYGMGVVGSGGGPTSGPRGNIRDSDNTMAAMNNANGQPYELFNWCVIFKKTEG
ncbi:sialate O-acetylesterase [Vibrio cholerae]